MKFQRIYQAVHFQPWLITPRAHNSIRELLNSKLFEVNAERPASDIFGEDLPVMTIHNGIATIPVHGVIGQKLGLLEKSCGAVGVEDISMDLRMAVSDPSAHAILLDISSPGGVIGGVPELASEIKAAASKKPVYAFTDSEMASAAYWLAASAGEIYASPSADIGSIGVYLPWIDQSAAYEARGLKVDLIKNTGGTYKGMGFPGTSLTEAQREELQAGVDEVYAMFAGHVIEARQDRDFVLSLEALRGQTFMADRAYKNGLTDGVKTREELIQHIQEAIIG